MAKKFISFLVAFFLLCTAISCAREEGEQKKICEAFASFEYSENYAFLTYRQLHVGKKVISLGDLKYEGKDCKIAFLEKDGAYAYALDGKEIISSDVESSSEENQITAVDVLFIKYADWSIQKVGSFEAVGRIITVAHFSGKLYFRALTPLGDKLEQGYYVFDLTEKSVELIKCETLEDQLGFDIEESADKNRSEKYSIEYYNNDLMGLLSGNRIKITDRQTGQSRILEKSIMHTFEEGEKILSFGEIHCAGFVEAYEKDGEIYLASMYLTDGGVGETTHIFIVKYNFSEHTAKFYTSVKIEDEYPESVYDLVVL